MAQQQIGYTRLEQRTSAAKSNANFTELYARHVRINPTATGNITFVVPAGYMIEHVLYQNTTANAVTGGVKMGTTAGGTEVLASQAIAANSLEVIPGGSFTKRVFSVTNDTTIYLNAITAWNGASVNFSIIVRKAY